MKTVIVGLGNDLLGDDGFGIFVARLIRPQAPPYVTVTETSVHGIALLDFLVGYDRAIIIDILCTGQAAPGTVFELSPDDFRPVHGPSPHYTGLPELISLGRQLPVKFPEDVRVLAVEAACCTTLGCPLTKPVAGAAKTVVARALACVDEWHRFEGCQNQPSQPTHSARRVRSSPA